MFSWTTGTSSSEEKTPQRYKLSSFLIIILLSACKGLVGTNSGNLNLFQFFLGFEASLCGDAVLSWSLLQPRLFRGHSTDHRPDTSRRRFDPFQPRLLRRKGLPHAVVAALPGDCHPFHGRRLLLRTILQSWTVTYPSTFGNYNQSMSVSIFFDEILKNCFEVFISVIKEVLSKIRCLNIFSRLSTRIWKLSVPSSRSPISWIDLKILSATLSNEFSRHPTRTSFTSSTQSSSHQSMFF